MLLHVKAQGLSYVPNISCQPLPGGPAYFCSLSSFTLYLVTTLPAYFLLSPGPLVSLKLSLEKGLDFQIL